MPGETKNTVGVDGSSKAGGLLLAAFRAGQTEEITWVDVHVDDLVVTVATDAMKAQLGDQTGVRLPVTYEEAVAICRELGCVEPTQAICDAMYAQAKAQLDHVPLVLKKADSAKMCHCEFVLTFHDRVEEQIAGAKTPPGKLVFGAWKHWILHPRIVEKGAVNYGSWDKKTQKPVQTVGGKHDAKHYDYSQLLQPVKRMARHAKTCEVVDLLDYFGSQNNIPTKYLNVYRPTQTTEETGGVPPKPSPSAAIDLLTLLTGAGVLVAPLDGWQTRGRPGEFKPLGIMLHHTAGSEKGDAPSLTMCINGRDNLSGPLCHIVLARSGTVHLIAAKKANHAGAGAQDVLDSVRIDKAVKGDARDNGFVDASNGNAHFYGIEVENSGASGDAYPKVQIDALVKVCAALCIAHGWSANRVVHHRQWTTRKVDMSYAGDITGAVFKTMSEMEEARSAHHAKGAGQGAAGVAKAHAPGKKAPRRRRARDKVASDSKPAGRGREKSTKGAAAAKNKRKAVGKAKPAKKGAPPAAARKARGAAASPKPKLSPKTQALKE